MNFRSKNIYTYTNTWINLHIYVSFQFAIIILHCGANAVHLKIVLSRPLFLFQTSDSNCILTIHVSCIPKCRKIAKNIVKHTHALSPRKIQILFQPFRVDAYAYNFVNHSCRYQCQNWMMKHEFNKFAIIEVLYVLYFCWCDCRA